MDAALGTIADRVRTVFDEMQRAAARAGRPPESVRLIAASKTVSVERLRQAVDAGIRHLGENRLQEALPKIDTLGREGVVWHFIGSLQRRKVKSVIGRFETIHSVDSLALAEEIDRQAKAAGLRQRVLLEVNLAGEASKGGFESTTLGAALESLNGLEHLDIRGLMAIPPPTPTAEDARPYFRQLRTLAQTLTARGHRNINMQELSMGMSHDYPVAIEEGATYVRVGTAIFGARGE
ncbi:MAG: YggS family pyridoxal phosphate-dependent enzyme [Nitrospira sp.]|jgi:pyridoxal phosphate enzyme (YggS family)|uniref:YggS family pyridoxal phosphate-dependent enzyme n=1 Tax=Nitrospira sp. ND1 TaxID=1658518 RepID=UPI0009BA9F4E|nr:YggS family pyridoxal phosphate-dependent enzyme [Nitrospira sp. ND1]MBK7418981.1 YggS family pyridoxal phosphate-dependent enzyme [Nitrospira sp.]OYT23267.1 MAG: YggS family pyridoxal phosphate enzyme [Nitrospira sp. UW-LDO-02]MBK9997807.1 YggS family pyridoxal phosphate-dependent enzyme [Nitrospira sp.]MBP6200384.1 YggS family pyridoxal phosphate-dependent enzyme [Nitrospira sp.]MBP6205904.1 YggS family pyridoxal phosphate-dependent enzyme [Nitrospira sp.]